MDRLLQDLRFALRLLWKDRGFTLTTVATLALCVAANTSIFAVVHAVLLKPLPFPEPDRLVTIFNSYPGAGAVRASNGVPDYYDRRAQMPALDEIAMYRLSGATVGGQGGEVERVTSLPVTPSFFRLLRTEPHRGQLFSEADADAGAPRKVAISYGTWQRLFGGRDDAIGRDLRLNGFPHTVVAVLPEEFRFVDPDVQVWIPVGFSAEERSDERRHSNNWQQVARLKPGATVEQAQVQVDAINAANLERFPQLKQVLINAGFNTGVKSFHADLVQDSQRTLYLLWGGVLTVLLIGCVNVANLVSVRASTRARELATRHALGASLQQLSRQIFTETLLVARRRRGDRPDRDRVRGRIDALGRLRHRFVPGRGAAPCGPRPGRQRRRALRHGLAPHARRAPGARHQPGRVCPGPAGGCRTPVCEFPACAGCRSRVRGRTRAHRHSHPARGAL
jgi:predicted permease